MTNITVDDGSVGAPRCHAWASISRTALLHNLQRARRVAPGAAICAVVKANAYGHGVRLIAEALAQQMSGSDRLAVVTLSEALELQTASIYGPTGAIPLLVMRGAVNQAEMDALLQGGFEFTIHTESQLALLESSLEQGLLPPGRALTVWVKVNTGMNRLGLPMHRVAAVWESVGALAARYRLHCQRILMSHLATSDDLEHPLTALQHKRIESLRSKLGMSTRDSISLAASAAVLAWPETHYAMVRPGIMLYGASPLLGRTGKQEGLEPVMTLKSRLIAVNHVAQNQDIGYGATYRSQREMTVGIIGIGYGDGYPRHAPTGTPVLVRTADGQVHERPVVGRVSMDMVAVDLTGVSAHIGDEVLLWGQAWGAYLPAERIADLCGTISYELFCQLTSRVKFLYD